MVRDPKRLIFESDSVAIKSRGYVSRGGVKLESALSVFDIQVSDKIVIDAGSSTGGFTDCLLRHGARRVFAVDSGYNQLDFKLREDPRVVVMEKTNIMDVSNFEPVPHFATADISFRSIRHVASHLLKMTSDHELIALIKPQFEWETPDRDFTGVIQRDDVLVEILKKVVSDLYNEGAFVKSVCESPIHGRRGNREFFVLLSAMQWVPREKTEGQIERIVLR